jgi:phosphoribosylglycinamide formyltransferase-1
MAEPVQLAVLVSGGGTTLQNLIDEIAAGRLSAQIKVVIASRPEIRALQRAADAKIMNFVVQPRGFEKVGEFSRKVFELCDDAGVDLVCLAGWLSLLEVPAKYQGRVMNIHPAVLPSPFGGKGMYGARVHEAVLAHGCKISGCTVHFVDNDYDAGPIIVQKCCPVMEGDTAQSLALRVSELEREAYPQAIRLFADGALTIDGRRVRIAWSRDGEPGR